MEGRRKGGNKAVRWIGIDNSTVRHSEVTGMEKGELSFVSDFRQSGGGVEAGGSPSVPWMSGTKEGRGAALNGA